jgi:hypothetical protein
MKIFEENVTYLFVSHDHLKGRGRTFSIFNIASTMIKDEWAGLSSFLEPSE